MSHEGLVERLVDRRTVLLHRPMHGVEGRVLLDEHHLRPEHALEEGVRFEVHEREGHRLLIEAAHPIRHLHPE